MAWDGDNLIFTYIMIWSFVSAAVIFCHLEGTWEERRFRERPPASCLLQIPFFEIGRSPVAESVKMVNEDKQIDLLKKKQTLYFLFICTILSPQ